jgi:hypothetical protein
VGTRRGRWCGRLSGRGVFRGLDLSLAIRVRQQRMCSKYRQSHFSRSAPARWMPKKFDLFCHDVARQHKKKKPCKGCKDYPNNLKADAVEIRQHFASFTGAGTLDESIWIDHVGYADAEEEDENHDTNREFPNAFPIVNCHILRVSRESQLFRDHSRKGRLFGKFFRGSAGAEKLCGVGSNFCKCSFNRRGAVMGLIFPGGVPTRFLRRFARLRWLG